MHEFGTLLKRYRVERRLPQEFLAQEAGLPVKEVSAFETLLKEPPGMDVLDRLGSALGLTRPEFNALVEASRRPNRISMVGIPKGASPLERALVFRLIGRIGHFKPDQLQRVANALEGKPR